MSLSQINVKSLWRVSFPLMISYLSLMAMLFIDRIFLAQYSASALNAAASAGTLAWSIDLGIVTLASMSEVFVAQYNGAKLFKKLGEPVWQMIWLSFFSVLLFIPIAIWGSNVIFPYESIPTQEHSYFKWMLIFGPVSVLQAGIGGFFIGQGKTNIIKWMGLLGNIVNIILDPIFIFGAGPIPSMGVVGAAIATGIGVSVQSLLLFVLFIRKSNRENYGCNQWKFQFAGFKKCCKIGLPPSIFVFLEIMAWAIFYKMMAEVSPIHIFVASICQSIIMLFLFFGFGIEKGAAALAGNIIGSGQIRKVYLILKSGLFLCIFFFLMCLIPLGFFSDFIINWFIQSPSLFEDPTLAQINMNLSEIKGVVKSSLFLLALYMLFENIRWLLSGILTSAGDTLFLMISGVSCVWLLMIVPSYLLIVKKHYSIHYAFIIWVVYSLISALFSLWRFFQGRWKEKQIISDRPSTPSIPSIDYLPD